MTDTSELQLEEARHAARSATSGKYRSSTPERRLLLAVLEDAIAIVVRPRPPASRRDARLLAEVSEWFRSEEAASPFAFVNVCALLDLDPDRVRRHLADLRRRLGTVAVAPLVKAASPLPT